MADGSHLSQAGALFVMPSLKIPLLSEPLDMNSQGERPFATGTEPSSMKEMDPLSRESPGNRPL